MAISLNRHITSLTILLAGMGIQLQLAADTPLRITKWFRRDYHIKEQIFPLKTQLTGDTITVTVPVDFSRSNEFFCKLPKGWTRTSEELECFISFPEDFPTTAQLYFSGKDWDSLWYNHQATLPTPLAGDQTFTLPLFGKSAREAWVPGRHKRPWHQLTAYQLREFGFKLDPPTGKTLKWAGNITVRLRLRENPLLKKDYVIENMRVNAKTLKVGETFETSLEVPYPFKDPFDKASVNLNAEIITPEGESVMVRCFYYEDFHFNKADEFSKLSPAGYPQFRMRFTPSKSGKHEVRIAGTVGPRFFRLPEILFTATADPENWKGFVHCMPESRQLLAYSEKNKEFWGLGLNVRSPFDTRYHDVFPATQWEPYNLNMYERLFKKYKENGITIAEVWMSSWWLSLEWIPDAPGNHGLGHMNQQRAWKLDRLLEWADKYDIHIILAIHNHGKFSSWCDTEWPRNPFNKANGGYLTHPDEYFISDKAKKDYRKFADYMVARWAHSPRILAWKLFTEIDLTGRRANDYRRPSIANWHRSAARYIKDKDPYNHLITTHWSTDVSKAEASPLLASARELDILTLDAYYLGRHNTSRLYSNLQRSLAFQKRIRKPCIITEFGGTPWADSIPLIRQQLHFSMWHGFFSGFPTAPFLWWFPLIEEQNLYGQFKSLAAFTKDEPRAGAFFGRTDVMHGMSRGLEFYQVRKPDRLLGWVVDRDYHLKNRKLYDPGSIHNGLSVTIEGLSPGRYSVEFFDCRTGLPVVGKGTAFTDGTVLKLPEFRKDIAFKISKEK